MMYKTITMDKLHRGHTHITGQSAYECEDLLFYLTLNIFMLLLLLIQLMKLSVDAYETTKCDSPLVK